MFTVVEDDLTGPAVVRLLADHLAGMHATSPPGSVHALDLEQLRDRDVTFWSAWDGDTLVGCGALKELAPDHGEIKSMRTAAGHLRRGVAAAILTRIVETARARGYARISLETGTGPEFDAAHALYARHGFGACGPFGSYVEDPFSAYFTQEL